MKAYESASHSKKGTNNSSSLVKDFWFALLKKHFLSYYGRIESDANNNESRDCTFGSFLHVYCYASRQCTAEYIIKFCSKSILCVAHRDDFNSESMKHDKISR